MEKEMNEVIKNHEQKIQAVRAAAMNIREHIDTLQLFCLQPSNRIAEKNKALETSIRIRRLASAILGTSDRLVNDKAALDPELLLDLMQMVIDGKIIGVRRVDLEKIYRKNCEMTEQLYNIIGPDDEPDAMEAA
ncbi:MAG TPA: hypothetical protein ENK33_06315 [Desulfobacterales bacterium]|nr:hypothetical protein [Desulfobacterales bacterium]